jgi:hypothetical protein
MNREETIRKIEETKASKNASDFIVILAPSYDTAKDLTDNTNIDFTVEAEYGDECVRGKKLTLAHHGSRSDNPAPCNDDRAHEAGKDEPSAILVSHLDLDTIGGILDLKGQKPKDDDFWKAAEDIDVRGAHHLNEHPKDIQDKLNAIWAWEAKQERRPKYTELSDVTDVVLENKQMLEIVLDDKHKEHDKYIEEGRQWAADIHQAVEKCLVCETDRIRMFYTPETGGPFCNVGYYSDDQNRIVNTILTYNGSSKSMILSTSGDNPDINCCEIMQSALGSEAGGHKGIAGSPRGKDQTDADLYKVMVELTDRSIISADEIDHMFNDMMMTAAVDVEKNDIAKKNLSPETVAQVANSPIINEAKTADGHIISSADYASEEDEPFRVIHIDGKELKMSRFFAGYDLRKTSMNDIQTLEQNPDMCIAVNIPEHEGTKKNGDVKKVKAGCYFIRPDLSKTNNSDYTNYECITKLPFGEMPNGTYHLKDAYLQTTREVIGPQTEDITMTSYMQSVRIPDLNTSRYDLYNATYALHVKEKEGINAEQDYVDYRHKVFDRSELSPTELEFAEKSVKKNSPVALYSFGDPNDKTTDGEREIIQRVAGETSRLVMSYPEMTKAAEERQSEKQTETKPAPEPVTKEKKPSSKVIAIGEAERRKFETEQKKFLEQSNGYSDNGKKIKNPDLTDIENAKNNDDDDFSI